MEQEKEKQGSMMKFRVVKETEFGETVLIVGDVPLLGDWDPSGALPLHFVRDKLWEVSVPTEDLFGGAASGREQVYFKYLLKKTPNSSELIWERGADRIRSRNDIANGNNNTPVEAWRDSFEEAQIGGDLYAWGCTKQKQLGLSRFNVNSDVNTPLSLSSSSYTEEIVCIEKPTRVDRMIYPAVTRVVCGGSHTLIEDDLGIVYTTGGFFSQKDQPVPVAGIRRKQIKSLACGAFTSMALDTSGSVYVWGEVAPGKPSGTRGVKKVELPEPIVQIDSGAGFSLALGESGTVYGWGINSSGALGIGDTQDHDTPQIVQTLQGKVAQVCCGGYHSVFVTTDGLLFVSGSNKSGQLGLGDDQDRSTPEQVKLPTGSQILKVAAASSATAVLTKDSQVILWGVILPETLEPSVPHAMNWPKLTEKIIDIACGGAFGTTHIALLTQSGDVWAMGDNRYGQCAKNPDKFPIVSEPELVLKGRSVIQVACGWMHTVAVTKQFGRVPLQQTPMGLFSQVSNKAINHIISFLPDAALVTLSQLNDTWKQLLESNELWKYLYNRHWGPYSELNESWVNLGQLQIGSYFEKYPKWKLQYIKRTYPLFFEKKAAEAIELLEKSKHCRVCKTWRMACAEDIFTPKVVDHALDVSGVADLEPLERLEMRLPGDPEWYKDAVFYEVFVRAFCDSNGDGIGDIPGLTSKLDYIKDLGVSCIWLLPITDSPLQDHGYDVADYYSVHPDYGTMGDVVKLIQEAHARGMRIMTEIVPNHTSDQHKWFQASRNPQSPEFATYRDWYLWSDTATPFALARIIFRDFETSNWTWDPLRKSFFYHRFFHHQPDLNYDNPSVQAAMLDIVRFWLKLGVDALRIDAPPYLFKREGTNCENLSQTHDFFRHLRRVVDTESPGVMLLSEANQWPEDVIKYFGESGTDGMREFHCNFHFPLMPRIFMALARHSRDPIDEIIARTPSLPPQCQWGTFLRNHDELTLEMVTPEDRQFMWSYFAPDPRMRLNLGIRRRLAPLLGNDLARIALAHSILLTVIGSPFLYYGDEIGMRDDFTMHDRSGCRTPMQWDPDLPNAGFSTASSEKLYLPVLPGCAQAGLTVAQQRKNKKSLLNWLKLALKVRRTSQAFGRGELHLIKVGGATSLSGNQDEMDLNFVLGYIRTTESEAVLVLNNLSPQEVIVRLPTDLIMAVLVGRSYPLKVMDLFTKNNSVIASFEGPGGVLSLYLQGYGFSWLSLQTQRSMPLFDLDRLPVK